MSEDEKDKATAAHMVVRSFDQAVEALQSLARSAAAYPTPVLPLDAVKAAVHAATAGLFAPDSNPFAAEFLASREAMEELRRFEMRAAAEWSGAA